MAKKKKALSEITKRRISESLSGQKLAARGSDINPEDAKDLRARVSFGDNFKHQALVDWWRNLKD